MTKEKRDSAKQGIEGQGMGFKRTYCNVNFLDSINQ